MKKYYLINVALLCVACAFGQTSKQAVANSPKTATTPKAAQQKEATPQRPKLPIEYFAKYNLFEDQIGNSNSNDKSSYYELSEAKQVCPKGWHLPTQEEWAGVFPYQNDLLHGKGEGVESITINGVTKNYFAEYKDVENATYAIRFKRDPEMRLDNHLLCAYRYEWINQDNPKEARMKITVRYLGSQFTGSIDDIAVDLYWKTNNKSDIIYEFPAAGETLRMSSDPSGVGYQGKYWTSSAPSTYSYYGCPRVVLFYGSWRIGNIHSFGCDNSLKAPGYIVRGEDKYCVRCIKNKDE